RTLKDKNKDEDKNAVASKSSENIRNDTFHKKRMKSKCEIVVKCFEGTKLLRKLARAPTQSWSHVHEISEIATLRAIQKHTNILQMLEIHYDEKLGKVSLVFELMDVNLYELIKDRKRLLPETRVRTIIFQLFRALRHLHKLGIFHRDIKPENILIKLKTDQLKLGDLGSVRGMFSRPPYTEYISTRWYRSPECLLTAGHYSNKMDIWAAGCVFYEVLTLRPLFPGSSELDQINRINNILGPPPIKLLETFQNKADVERDTFRNQNQKARRQQIQKVLDGYKSKYILQVGESKSNSNKSLRTSKNSLETGPVYFSERTGTGLEKMLPSHITREAREIIKNCLAYDPEQRPSAQRTIQLPYFYELRESYAKNPEKVSSKPVVAICDETVMEYREPIDLGTLGDNKKKRHHRPQHQTVVQEVYRKSKDSSKISPKKGSSKLEVNNNYTSSPNNSIGSLSRISNISRVQGSKTNLTKQQVLQVRKSEDTLPTDSYGKLHNSRHLVNAETSRSSYKVVSSSTGNARSKNNFETEVRKRIHSTSYESIQSEGKQKGKNALEEKSFSTINTVSLNEKVVSTRRLKDSDESLASIDTKMSKDSESCTTASRKDFRRSNNALNNNTVRQSQEKLRKTNASSHKMEHVGQNIKKSVLPSDVSPYMQAPSELKFLQKKIKSNTTKKPTNLVFNHPQQQQQQTVSSQMDKGRVQQNNGKHESTKVSVVPPKVAAAAIKYAKSLNQNNSAAVARQLREVLGDAPTARSGAYSPNESSYAASSVKVGKLRFRQAQHQTTKGRASPDNYQRSKIPVPIDDGEISRKSYKSSKLTSPPQSIREKDITDKWRNTGIPRMIPMSPERERNINLIRESLTMDKNKRLKIRQEAINNSHKNDFEYDPLASQDTSQHQQRVTETYSSGRYLNSTTDYENIECQETSSSAAPAENHIFEQRTMMIKLPELTEEIKKPGLKSSGMYSDLHEGSRYKVASSLAATDVNMNILNDGGGYKKRPDRNEDIKEKLDQKIHTQRHKNSSSVGDRDHTKLARESRNYEYNRYSSGVATNNRPSGSTLPREDEPLRRKRPPVPPTKIHGSRNADMNKEHQRREHSPEPLTMKIGPPYHHAKRANRTSEAVKEYSPKHSKKTRRTAETRKEYKEHGKRRSGRMKSTMRVVRGEEVWCSSDDDIMETMRKKFDDLISERARRLTESLKTHPIPISNEARKACNSRSEDDVSVKRLGIEKPIKYARRQLRARMAESLIANNYPNWRDALPDHLAGQNLHLSHGLIQNNTSNNSGDFVAPSHDTRTMRESEEKYHDKQRQPAVLDLRQSKKDYHDGHNFKNRRGDESRLYSFLQDSNKGQIYTPQGNKPVYQSPPSQVGATLNDRKLRYSHNSLVPVANHSTYTQRRNHNEDDIRNRRRI
ncbi:MAPK/MAK/MRK overlapping kinase, partial [Orchesella cincta]